MSPGCCDIFLQMHIIVEKFPISMDKIIREVEDVRSNNHRILWGNCYC